MALAIVAAASDAPPVPGVFGTSTKASGIDFRIGTDLRHLKLIPTMVGGCAFGDYDGDGRPDLYVTNSIPKWGKANTKRCGRLFHNLGGGRFEDVTDRLGDPRLRSRGWGPSGWISTATAGSISI